jgi:outer membrane protein OmpA-like peptidoglycan-associated protein
MVDTTTSLRAAAARKPRAGLPGFLAAALTPVLVLAACSLAPPSDQSGLPYMVYFQPRSAKLDPPAHDIVTLVAARANEAPAARITVTGYTDSAGSPPADVLLARQRAQSVAHALASKGVAAHRIVRIAAGQTNEDPGLASRRVEIAIGG